MNGAGWTGSAPTWGHLLRPEQFGHEATFRCHVAGGLVQRGCRRILMADHQMQGPGAGGDGGTFGGIEQGSTQTSATGDRSKIELRQECVSPVPLEVVSPSDDVVADSDLVDLCQTNGTKAEVTDEPTERSFASLRRPWDPLSPVEIHHHLEHDPKVRHVSRTERCHSHPAQCVRGTRDGQLRRHFPVASDHRRIAD